MAGLFQPSDHARLGHAILVEQYDEWIASGPRLVDPRIDRGPQALVARHSNHPGLDAGVTRLTLDPIDGHSSRSIVNHDHMANLARNSFQPTEKGLQVGLVSHDDCSYILAMFYYIGIGHWFRWSLSIH